MIKYLKGDATSPVGDGHKIIAHCCNDIGVWGAGFVLAISKKWPIVPACYRGLKTYDLGDVQFVKATENITVANIIGQHNINQGYRTAGVPPIRYEAIEAGLRVVAYRAWFLWDAKPSSVHMPRIGCGLAGGSWDKMEPIIERTLKGLDVYVYDL